MALLQAETYGLLAYIVDKLFRLAFFGDTPEAQQKAMTDAELRLFWPLVNLVCHVGRVELTAKTAILGLLRAPSAYPNGTVLSADEARQRDDAMARLIGFCDFFADHYLIAVEVPVPLGNRLVIRYSRSVPMYGQTATFADRLRVRLGLSPFRFTYPLTLPFDAHSYHFRMPAGQSRFLVDQRLLDWTNGTTINQETYALASPRPYLRVRRRAGLPYAHFYTRGLNYATRHELWTRVEFDEVPPGALGGAAIISATCAILIWFFTLVQPGLRAMPSGPEPNIDMPALLLAVPAFAATWVGHSTERVLRSSISAYVGLAVAAATSACSALVYIANSNHKALYRIGHLTWFHGLIRLNNVDVTWIVLALISSFASAYLAESLRDKVRWYTRMLERWGKPS